MPNIVGMNYNDAIKLLTSNKLNCTYTSVFDDNVPINEVMTQNPAAGTTINPYSNVTLTYSIGPQPETQTVTYEYEVPVNDNPDTTTTTTNWKDMPFEDFVVGTWTASCLNENFDEPIEYYSPGEIVLKINSDFTYEMWLENKHYSSTYSISPSYDRYGNDRSQLFLRNAPTGWGDVVRNDNGDLINRHNDSGWYNTVFKRQ